MKGGTKENRMELRERKNHLFIKLKKQKE